MPRFFLAIDIPGDVKSRLAALQDRLPRQACLVQPEQLHITLKFLGWLDTVDIAALEKIEHRPFDLTLHGVGGFPNISRPRVIFVGGPAQQAATELSEKVDFVTKNVEMDKPFHMHVTLARLKGKIDFDFSGLSFDEMTFKVGEFVLYRSDLRKTGPIYTVVERFTLGG